jgi:hypothetical protein
MLLALFAAGVVEYGLAALWTQCLIAQRAGLTGGVTFLNVMLWGFVITNLKPGDPWAIITHGLGCALGAAATVWYSRRSGRGQGAEAKPSSSS